MITSLHTGERGHGHMTGNTLIAPAVQRMMSVGGNIFQLLGMTRGTRGREVGQDQ